VTGMMMKIDHPTLPDRFESCFRRTGRHATACSPPGFTGSLLPTD
jgi:hypothetical protein